jgi:hypothetical protein
MASRKFDAASWDRRVPSSRVFRERPAGCSTPPIGFSAGRGSFSSSGCCFFCCHALRAGVLFLPARPAALRIDYLSLKTLAAFRALMVASRRL